MSNLPSGPCESVDDGDDRAFDMTEFYLGPSTMDNHPSTETSSSHSSDSSPQTSEQDWRTETVGFRHADSSSMMDRPRSLSPDAREDYLAIGAIRLLRHEEDEIEGKWHMVGPKEIPHPHPLLTLGLKRGWISTVFIQHVSKPDRAALKVYALPEDVNRSNRGSIKDLRKVLKFLAEFIDTSPQAWHGNYDPLVPVRSYMRPEMSQEESLFYIFNTLNSPQPCLDDAGPVEYNQHSMHDIYRDRINGLKTTLYPYQKRSIAAMLQKEVHPSKSYDARKPKFRDLNGIDFYFDVEEGVLLRHPHLYSECRGGILAETMGYGKTLICIALILATRGHYPNIPEGRVNVVHDNRHKRTPSLLELAAKKIKQDGIPWKSQFATLKKDGYHFDACMSTLGKYHGEYIQPIFKPETRSRINEKREDFTVLRLAYSTLLIVPPNLLLQWQHEIEKHTQKDALDVLVLDSTTKDLPHWSTLMEYDIVLITKARFEQEYRDDDLNQGRLSKGQDKFRSQLTELRWLRVICDEGHGFAGSSYRTHAMAMLDKMSIERRWVVSGTPSHSLHGVEVNLALNEVSNEIDDDTEQSRKVSIQKALERRKTKDIADNELKDMDRLRAIVVNFLKVQPWANAKGDDYADWKKYLHPFDATGKRRFAPALRTILQSLIVRHRIEDIDSDLCLPPLYNTAVYLEPSYYDKISMNLFRMVLASNAVTSERVDEDYMFNPKNRKSLDELVNNLRRSSFHWVGFTEHAVAETLRVSNKYIDEHLDSISDEDGTLLMEAVMNGERALGDSGWKAFSFYHEIGVYVQDFPEDAAQVWALDAESSNPLLLGTVQARAAQQYVVKSLGSSEPGAGLVGAGLRAMIAARERATEEQKATEKASQTSNGKSPTAGTAEEPKAKAQSATSLSLRASKKDTPFEAVIANRKRRFSMSSAELPGPLAKSRIVGFTSAKLNYLCSRVLSLQATEKIIIFYDSNNVAFWIAEALELLSVNFLIYANTLSVTRREAYMATFNQSEVFRVLLMDLKQASHGLHVAAASRIFIVSPIWQPDVESQAIKRAHRIGQTRPVYVETLVLKGTLEEKILHRRKQMSNSELVKAEKSLLDDGTMNEMIRGEGFLKIVEGEKDQMRGGRLDSPVPFFERRDGAVDAVGSGDGELILGLEGEHASKKRRKRGTMAKKQEKGEEKGKGKEKAVTFGIAGTGAGVSSPPPTPVPAVQSQVSTSIFGSGSPSTPSGKPKKSVGFAAEIPTPP